MRDQHAHAIDDIGLAGVADPDAGDQIPDEAQIDFGHDHVRIAAGAPRGERHERLGVAEEVDRPIIGAAFTGAAESRAG
jgi:hypothetical protein